jgi:AcrR family transcriptional regulator
MTTDALVPQQDRSRRTHAAILTAGTELLSEGGVDALVVSAVAERAGVSVGGIYRRFGTKDQLLLALQEHFTAGFLEKFQALIADASDEMDGPELVRLGVSSLAATLSGQADLSRVFILISTQHEKVREVGSRFSHTLGDAFRALLRRAAHTIVRPDPEASIDFVYRLAYAAFEHRVIHPNGEFLESDLPLSWSSLIDELTLAAELYLFFTPRR